MSDKVRYRIVMRMKSGRVYHFRMNKELFNKILMMLLIEGSESFIRIENEVINLHEIEHLEYFEIEINDRPFDEAFKAVVKGKG